MWCVHLSMVMAVHALRDMQRAADPRAKSAAGLQTSEVSGDDGKCLAKPEHEDKDIWGACGIFKDQGRCNMRYVCHWVLPTVVPGHCEGKSSHPHHKMLCDGLKYDKSVCESQTLTCNWIPESKVYGNAGPSAPSVSSLGGDGMCKVKPGYETVGKACGFQNDKDSCDMRFVCHWVVPTIVPAHCEGKSAHPHHKMLCDGLNSFWCNSQVMFCNWVAEQKVYD